MKILKKDFVAGAQAAEGIAVIIDVFRAFSTACYCLDGKAKRILPAGSITEALSLKAQFAEAILIGERSGKKIDGFDYGNSPTELLHADLVGKEIILTTHSGVQGLVNAKNADEVLTGAFVNAQATASYIRSKAPAVVTLVRMGWQAETPSEEDNLYADYLESLLLGTSFAVESIPARLKASPCSERFFDPAKPWSPSTDFDLCLRVNAFDFVIGTTTDQEGRLVLAQR